MSNDAKLIYFLGQLKEAAAVSIEHQQVPLDRRPPSFQDLWSMSKPIADALNEHPEFNKVDDKFFLGYQLSLHPQMQAANLLKVAVLTNPLRALEWYRKVVSTEEAAMRIVGQVNGLHVEEACTFSNGVRLLPFSALPDSPNSSILKQGSMLGPGQGLPSAITFELSAITNEDSETGQRRYMEIADLMRRMMHAYTLAGNASPIVSETWVEFIDRDLEAAQIGRSWQMNMTDGVRPDFGHTVTSEAIDWVEKYLGPPEEIMKACDVSLARLNVASRRISPGDKALDGSICLEALLSGRGRGDLTHKLAVRTALLLGKSVAEREAISKRVRKFYELRSAVVHGGAGKNQDFERTTANDGLELCRSALREIIDKRTLPEPEMWELSGGPPWNMIHR